MVKPPPQSVRKTHNSLVEKYPGKQGYMRWQDLGPSSKFLSKLPLLKVDPNTPVIPAPKNLRQEDGRLFRDNLSYIVRTCFLKTRQE